MLQCEKVEKPKFETLLLYFNVHEINDWDAYASYFYIYMDTHIYKVSSIHCNLMA